MIVRTPKEYFSKDYILYHMYNRRLYESGMYEWDQKTENHLELFLYFFVVLLPFLSSVEGKKVNNQLRSTEKIRMYITNDFNSQSQWFFNLRSYRLIRPSKKLTFCSFSSTGIILTSTVLQTSTSIIILLDENSTCYCH